MRGQRKLPFVGQALRWPWRQTRLTIARKSERGSIMVVVLVLTLVMLSLLLVNSASVLRLRKELHHIDQKQQQKYATTAEMI